MLIFTRTLWVTCISCALLGLGVGAATVSAYVQALMDAKYVKLNSVSSELQAVT